MTQWCFGAKVSHTGLLGPFGIGTHVGLYVIVHFGRGFSFREAQICTDYLPCALKYANDNNITLALKYVTDTSTRFGLP